MVMARARSPIMTIATDQAKLDMIREMIDKAEGNISYAARLLEMDQSNLRRLMRKLNFPGYPYAVKASAEISAISAPQGVQNVQN